ncbi:MAG: AAA family ATPase [Saprospiraceae bacterium]|nr:AAA family ATPase [Saprospiraceae bacterium]
MAIKYRIKGNTETSEYQDAIVLKGIFENEFRNLQVDGEILIISNATLFGQDTKDVDIIVVGKFDNYFTRVKTKSKVGKDQVLEQEERTLFINDFCFVVETKKHRAEDIMLNGLTLLVRYNNKLSDVTTQSENQKYALTNYFKDRIGFSPYICNFIWLRNISSTSLKQLIGDIVSDKHNYLPNTFNVKWLWQLACIQSIPYNPTEKETGRPKKYCSFKSLRNKQEYDFAEVDRIFDLFTKVQQGAGDLTRKKIEHITRGLLKDQKYAQAIGEKLVIVSGRAGTGKTIKLLTIACDLAEKQGARSIILTYNHALVSDIKRTLALAEIPDDVDDYSVGISTLHKFFYDVLLGFEIGTTKTKNDKLFIPNYLTQYHKLLEELYKYVENNLIGEVEIENLMKTRHQQVAWDFVLIDEAQDWDDIEKKLVYFIFGKEKVIIADGVDQLIRSQKKCNWKQGLRKEIDFRQTNEKKGLRQKVDLVNFVIQVAKKLNVYWELEPKEDLYGGKIIVKIGDYTKELHEREFEICKGQGNSAYEMMFLVPPNLVNRSQAMDEFGKSKEVRSFSKKNDFSQKGIKIWDGTSTDLRTAYPVNLDEHRLLQYESCRGLEGWVVVCLDLDEFMKYKFETFEEVETGELALESFEEKRNKFVNLWTLIPLTRAIDTIIITIKNKESKIAKLLYEMYKLNPDTIEWIE